MAKFRKKAVEIEALQFVGNNYDEIFSFIGDSRTAYRKGDTLVIKTLEGDHIASVNDWIIRGVKNEFYPCKPDIFAATYEQI